MQSMITTQLLCPQSIVVVGASNNTHKPGGAILKNLINGGYQKMTVFSTTILIYLIKNRY